MLGGAITAFLLLLQHLDPQELASTPKSTIIILGTSCLAFATAFLAFETWGTNNPLIPLSLLRKNKIGIICLVTALLHAGYIIVCEASPPPFLTWLKWETRVFVYWWKLDIFQHFRVLCSLDKRFSSCRKFIPTTICHRRRYRLGASRYSNQEVRLYSLLRTLFHRVVYIFPIPRANLLKTGQNLQEPSTFYCWHYSRCHQLFNDPCTVVLRNFTPSMGAYIYIHWRIRDRMCHVFPILFAVHQRDQQRR